MLIDWGCAQEVCEGDGAPLVSCGRWRRPREAEGFEEAVRGFRTARTCGFGGPFALCFLLQVSRRASSQTLGRDVEELPQAAGRGTPSPESACGWSLRFYESGANHPVSSPGLRPADRYGVEINSSTSIMGPSIPAKTREVLVSHLASYNTWALQGIEFVAAQLKSLVLTLGLIDLHLTVEQAVLLSRLEEEYQIQKWGNIEWAHDYELQELRARTAAGTLFIHLCSESTTVKHKLLNE
ncbi:ATP synthase mitochondrial F1 complex assembly factor 2 isoform X4 [Papio anubis]|uniref:ATP synthase mitochondrial F1 complex assembly factor 2 isoform X4 n=1 Tax=Papio anubis TaxID=9555 RepID=UPI000B7BA382|nr:ATP synthase mitochondrial F1 complex assembly factor 2 isoform X4 [Papio anubis]